MVARPTRADLAPARARLTARNAAIGKRMSRQARAVWSRCRSVATSARFVSELQVEKAEGPVVDRSGDPGASPHRRRRRDRRRAPSDPFNLGSPMDVHAVVARLWPDGGALVEPLGGGITNHNFKVTVGGEAFVLRIG